jgi:predicted DCC family thiol-disulfide oxidoreductase YuxK
MDIAYPLTVYFDASCRLCNSEMQNIKAHDTQNQLILIDCSVQDFDDTVCRLKNISQSAMMNRLHAQDANGQWLIGVDAFEVVYQTVGMAFIAKLWGGSITRPWAERMYPWVVKHRYIFSAIGLPGLLNLWARYAARKAEKNSRKCSKGRCTTKE